MSGHHNYHHLQEPYFYQRRQRPPQPVPPLVQQPQHYPPAQVTFPHYNNAAQQPLPPQQTALFPGAAVQTTTPPVARHEQEEENDEGLSTATNEKEEEDAEAPPPKKKKKDWRNYPRYNFNKSQGRKRLKGAAEALKTATENLEESRAALKEAEAMHAARLQAHQEISHQVVDELLETEKPRPWNKVYFQLREFYEQHGHCLLSVRASTHLKKIDKKKGKKKKNKKKKKGNKEEEKEEEKETTDNPEEEKENGTNDSTDVNDNKINAEQIGSLGRWAAAQRLHRKKGKLEDWKIYALDRLGFVWDAREALWHETYQELKQFHAQHGHVRVLEKENPSLNRWLRFQRDNYREFQTNGFVAASEAVFGMNQERCDLLEALGMDWREHDERWVVLFEKLKEVYQTQGHLRTLPSTGKYSAKLKHFVAKQRAAYKVYVQNKGGGDSPEGITKERVLLLESIHFPWTEQDELNLLAELPARNAEDSSNQWMMDFKMVQAFYQTQQHLNYEEGPNKAEAKRMRAWDNLQRQELSNQKSKSKSKSKSMVQNNLTLERLELLHLLGFFQHNGTEEEEAQSAKPPPPKKRPSSSEGDRPAKKREQQQALEQPNNQQGEESQAAEATATGQQD